MNLISARLKLRQFFKMIKLLSFHWKAIVVLFILSVFIVILGLVNPFLSKLVIDRAFAGRSMKAFVSLVITGGGVYFLNGFFIGLKSYLGKKTREKVNFYMHWRIFRHLRGLSLSYFRDKSQGDQLHTVNYDLDRIADFLVLGLSEIMAFLFRLVLVLVIVFSLNWQIALFVVLFSPVLYFCPFYFAKKRISLGEAIYKKHGDIFRRLAEFFIKIMLIKSFATETREVRRYLRGKLAFLQVNIKQAKMDFFGNLFNDWASRIITGTVAFWGGAQVVKGQMTLGSLSALMLYLNQLVGLNSSFSVYFQDTAAALNACERINQIFEVLPEIVEAKDARSVIFEKGEVEFRKVSFGYQKSLPVLRNLDFGINPHQHICFVGPSGCGKTTVLNIILRLYDPWEGEVLIDGHNLKELRLGSLKDNFGVALQEAYLWNDSLRNNLLYAKGNFSESLMKEVAGVCLVDRFVERLSAGYDTIIGDNACKLSEGQKQKISIARALMKKPKILILDEAMSSMDSASEELIMRNIKETYPGMGIISVSHRLSTVMACDLVYFIKSPDTLIKESAGKMFDRDENFRALFAGQAYLGNELK